MKIGGIVFPEGAGLAPMAGVTDAVMRLICAEMGSAWTVSEMLSAKGYVYNPEARVHSELLMLSPGEGISGLQLFGSEEYMLSEAVKRLNESKFAFFDFNMGCPAHKIVSNGEGSALMREPVKAARAVRAMVRAAIKPVTVKIRSGWDAEHINAAEIAKICQEEGASALTVHPRTREMGYSGKADWDIIASVRQAVKIPVIGNGDIKSGGDALKMRRETGCDAVCVARAAQGNPWIFAQIRSAFEGGTCAPPTFAQRIDMAVRHAKMQVDALGERMGVLEMRKHIAWYLAGMPASAKLRGEVNVFTELKQVIALLEGYKNTLSDSEAG